MQNQIHVLVPTGFSEQSFEALEQAISFTRTIGGKITLLAVLEADTGMLSFLFSDKDKVSEAKAKVMERLHGVIDGYKNQGVHITPEVRDGKVYDQIVHASEDLAVDYIIMGTDGEPKGFRKKVLGSNAYRVVSMANCPVITIGGTEQRFGIKHIMLPLDLQKETKQKVGLAVELAKKFDSTIHVVSAMDSSDEFIVNHLKRNMAQVVRHLEEKRVKHDHELIKVLPDESVEQVLMDYAEKVKADVIVMMTQEEMGLTAHVVGSLAQKIIHHSNVPVLSVRPHSTGFVSGPIGT